MNTRDLISFCQIYERRSINHAARDMFITAQGLSKVIQNLEAEFGVTHFVRTYIMTIVQTACQTIRVLSQTVTPMD